MDKALIEFCYMPAALSALESFPIDAEKVEFIAHSENVTFRILVRDCNTDYVLRLHRPGYNTIEELESERTWTRELSESGISAPDSLVTRSGKNFVLTEIPGTDEQCYAGITTWFEGVPVSEYLTKSYDEDWRKRIFRRIGAIAAEVHNQSANWNVPPGFTRRRLDLDGLLGRSAVRDGLVESDGHRLADTDHRAVSGRHVGHRQILGRLCLETHPCVDSAAEAEGFSGQGVALVVSQRFGRRPRQAVGAEFAGDDLTVAVDHIHRSQHTVTRGDRDGTVDGDTDFTVGHRSLQSRNEQVGIGNTFVEER